MLNSHILYHFVVAIAMSGPSASTFGNGNERERSKSEPVGLYVVSIILVI